MPFQMMTPLETIPADTTWKLSSLHLRGFVRVDVVFVPLEMVLPFEDAATLRTHEGMFV
jgi:hypothetical protein